MSSRSRRTGGRIFPHQRETNDGAGILGNDLVGAIGGELREAVQATIASFGYEPEDAHGLQETDIQDHQILQRVRARLLRGWSKAARG